MIPRAGIVARGHPGWITLTLYVYRKPQRKQTLSFTRNYWVLNTHKQTSVY